MDQSDTETLTVDIADLLKTPPDFDLIPEPPDITAVVNIMESDQPSGLDEWSIHFEIALNAIVRMITIDEEEIEATIANQFGYAR